MRPIKEILAMTHYEIIARTDLFIDARDIMISIFF